MPRFHESADERALRLARIRREIAAGEYDSPERLEAAIEAFLASSDAAPDRNSGARASESRSVDGGFH